ncbi:hypothetical protein CAPTEDRAFT_193218 [Capitella teleta]|uniref:Uncharacterized protein n=1 Tax=Capitella teleta TaxID=283909 RepID=R7TJ14_CAPTE|nr:hypothetical protein CAPTEDRAFT_193218 [Capitella teleta]|eukprot:ELT93482.1 hypothetical protein CAPTEDRAFT_193218 [Capitella teleta]
MPKECDDLDRFIITLNKCVTQVMDELAPKRNIRLKGETLKPWYSDAIHDARRKRRSIERLLRKSGLEVHRQMLKAQRKVVVNMIDQAKSDYIRDSITGEDSKRTFEIIDKMLNIRENAGTELTQNSEERANIFADFFTNKITTIRKELENVIDSSPSEANVLLPNHSLTSYNVVTENALWYMLYVRKIALSSSENNLYLAHFAKPNQHPLPLLPTSAFFQPPFIWIFYNKLD